MSESLHAPARSRAPDGRRSWRRHPFARRAPFLILVALGAWFFLDARKDERTLELSLEGPGWEQISALDLQLADGDGALVKREERYFHHGAPPVVSLEVRLPEGTYRGRVFPRAKDGRTPAALAFDVHVADSPKLLATTRLAARAR